MIFGYSLSFAPAFPNNHTNEGKSCQSHLSVQSNLSVKSPTPSQISHSHLIAPAFFCHHHKQSYQWCNEYSMGWWQSIVVTWYDFANLSLSCSYDSWICLLYVSIDLCDHYGSIDLWIFCWSYEGKPSNHTDPVKSLSQIAYSTSNFPLQPNQQLNCWSPLTVISQFIHMIIFISIWHLAV